MSYSHFTSPSQDNEQDLYITQQAQTIQELENELATLNARIAAIELLTSGLSYADSTLTITGDLQTDNDLTTSSDLHISTGSLWFGATEQSIAFSTTESDKLDDIAAPKELYKGSLTQLETIGVSSFSLNTGYSGTHTFKLSAFLTDATNFISAGLVTAGGIFDEDGKRYSVSLQVALVGLTNISTFTVAPTVKNSTYGASFNAPSAGYVGKSTNSQGKMYGELCVVPSIFFETSGAADIDFLVTYDFTSHGTDACEVIASLNIVELY